MVPDNPTEKRTVSENPTEARMCPWCTTDAKKWTNDLWYRRRERKVMRYGTVKDKSGNSLRFGGNLLLHMG